MFKGKLEAFDQQLSVTFDLKSLRTILDPKIRIEFLLLVRIKKKSKLYFKHIEYPGGQQYCI